jgi:hypothetical protein
MLLHTDGKLIVRSTSQALNQEQQPDAIQWAIVELEQSDSSSVTT